MTTLMEIEMATKAFATAHHDLVELVQELNDEVQAAKRRRMERLKRLVAVAAERKSQLAGLVQVSDQLFVKPRTLVFHGVKVGFQNGKGGIAWDDADQVVKLIRKHFPDQAEVLIHVEETPRKQALKELTVADLKKLGCTVKDSGDEVVIKPLESDVEKVVAALLKDAADVAAVN